MSWQVFRTSYGGADISEGSVSHLSGTPVNELKKLHGKEELAKLEAKKKYLEEKIHALHLRIERLTMAKRRKPPLSKTKTALKAVIDQERCFCCGRCADVCPEGAITMMESPWIDRVSCTGCGTCIPLCPRDAISLQYVPEERG
jgi:ferredoxin